MKWFNLELGPAGVRAIAADAGKYSTLCEGYHEARAVGLRYLTSADRQALRTDDDSTLNVQLDM